jgi:hypothetical protein
MFRAFRIAITPTSECDVSALTGVYFLCASGDQFCDGRGNHHDESQERRKQLRIARSLSGQCGDGAQIETNVWASLHPPRRIAK